MTNSPFFFKIVGKKKVLYLQCINMCLETHEQANIYYKSITSKKKKKPKLLIGFMQRYWMQTNIQKIFFIRDR